MFADSAPFDIVSADSCLGDILIRETADSEQEGRKYYENSIAVKVNQKSQSDWVDSHLTSPYLGLPPPVVTLGSNAVPFDTFKIANLSFEMWISPPRELPLIDNKVLHTYTRLQGNIGPIPLDDINDWRYLYPHLRQALSEDGPTRNYDIIYMKTGFKLYSDFPPRHSQLGIGLELEFLRPGQGDSRTHGNFLGEMVCTTHIYEGGHYAREPGGHHSRAPTVTTCREADKHAQPGRIKPTFESHWWAITFVTMTEKLRKAEDSGHPETLKKARKDCRDYLSSLTIMQELKTMTAAHDSLNDLYGQPSEPRRAVVLLWKFSEVLSPSWAGTTTWQRVIPPVDRSMPLSFGQTALPQLELDPVINDVAEHENYGEGDLSDDHQLQYSMAFGNELDHDSGVHMEGFDITYKNVHEQQVVDYNKPFNVPGTDQLSQHSFNDLGNPVNDHQLQSFSADDLQAHDLELHYGSDLPLVFDCIKPSNGYYGSDLAQPRVETPHSGRLAGFDHSTHELLQAQLDQHQSPHEPQASSNEQPEDDYEEQVRKALMAAPAMNDLVSSTSHVEHASNNSLTMQGGPCPAQSESWLERPSLRPPLPHNASYISHASYQTRQSPVTDHMSPPQIEEFDPVHFPPTLTPQ